MTTSITPQELAFRVQALERQNHWFRCGAAAVLLFGGALVLLGQAAPEKEAEATVVKAHAFELVDADGKTIASFDGREGPSKVTFRIYGRGGKDRMVIESLEEGTALTLSHPTGNSVSLLVSEEGPSVGLEQPSRKARAALGIGKIGAWLNVTDQGHLGAAVAAGSSGGQIVLM